MDDVRADGDDVVVTIDVAPPPRRPTPNRPTPPALPPVPTRGGVVPAPVEVPAPDAVPVPRQRSTTGPSARRPTARLILAALVTTGLAVVSVAYATTHSERADLAASPRTRIATPTALPPSSATSTSTSALPGVQRAALTWIAANIPPRTTILADPTLAPRLRAAGFTAASTGTTAGSGQPRYVVAGAALRADPAALTALTRSVPVARFGTGSAAVQVRSVLGLTAAHTAAALATDRTNRRMAGTALAANPRVDATPAVRAVLRSGALDLRAATFLALLSGQQQVRVISAPSDPAAVGLNRPRRVLTILASSTGATAVRAVAAALPENYAPTRVNSSQRGPSQALSLTWSPTARPVDPVS